MKVTKWCGRLVVVLGVFGGLLVAAQPASANVGISGSLQMPSGRSVGAGGLAGSLTVRNTNTAPQQGDSNTVTQLRLVPSCGTTSTSTNLCGAPDPGVFTIGSTATGASGTACAGRAFSVSPPDSIGAVVFTPSSPVVLPPPSGVAGANECRVSFTVAVRKMPTIDADGATAGVQTRANAHLSTRHASGLVVSSRPSVLLTVVKGSPALATRGTRNAAAGTMTVTATVTAPTGAVVPTGTVTFKLYAPGDTTCVGPLLGQSTNALSGGTATSAPFSSTAAGTHRVIASYSGDANYLPALTACQALLETAPPPPPVREAVADFNGNGTTDVSVYRPSTGYWYVHTPFSAVSWGGAGDIPVPGDYNGDGTTERAVFRPATGTWFIHGPSPVTQQFGQNGDVPVPADYDGNGTTDLAVFRKSTGVWYVQSLGLAVAWGDDNDVPVPGDYDGDGDAEIAIFRPANGNWYVRTPALVATTWGVMGDIPVPGDYDGNGSTDIAVWRPSNATWYVRTPFSAVQWGAAGFIPVPGDYDGNGTTDRAVYRPSNGTWYLLTPSPVATQWGIPGDIPLPIPHAIYRKYF